MLENIYKYKKNSLLLSGCFLLIVGGIFLFLEDTFYQYVDEQGFLHESLFLPLGVFSFLLGVLILFIWVLILFIAMIRKILQKQHK